MNLNLQIIIKTFILTIVVGFIVVPILKKLKVGQIVRTDGPTSHLGKKRNTNYGRNNHANIAYYSDSWRIYILHGAK
jgi:hypothetical protein